jgi:histidinol-phosphate aminotransferase
VREATFSFLISKNIEFIPSDSNCFLLNTKRPAREFMAAMQGEKVYVGRSWPALPTYSRITVGTMDEMKKFQQAVAKVMA